MMRGAGVVVAYKQQEFSSGSWKPQVRVQHGQIWVGTHFWVVDSPGGEQSEAESSPLTLRRTLISLMGAPPYALS